ncbi:MAG: hypothetical protein ACI81L_001382 [Verrucomicrobiales bacterium]|jgi:hypothetical protein
MRPMVTLTIVLLLVVILGAALTQFVLLAN